VACDPELATCPQAPAGRCCRVQTYTTAMTGWVNGWRGKHCIALAPRDLQVSVTVVVSAHCSRVDLAAIGRHVDSPHL
jgi:hypothetical protein